MIKVQGETEASRQQQATCSVTARIMFGCVLHNAPTGTAPALKAVSAVSAGEEMPIEER